MPLTSSLVDQISASFRNFYSPIKEKFPGEKGKIQLRQEQRLVLAPKIF